MNSITSGAYSLTKGGPGTLVLTGADTYSGATAVYPGGGTLTLAGANGTILSTSSITVSTGGMLKLDNTVSNTNRIPVVVTTLQGGTFYMTAGTETAGGLTISGTGQSIVKADAGTLTFGTLTATSSGGVVDFKGAGNVQVTSANDGTGILNARATFNGADWAIKTTGAGTPTSAATLPTRPSTRRAAPIPTTSRSHPTAPPRSAPASP